MTKHFHNELEKIKKMILSLGATVEERVHLAIESILNNQIELAQKVIDTDYEIDALEVEVEEEILKVMALYQPVAVDLRFLVAVLKINNELERIGDQAVNIAQRMKVLAKEPRAEFFFDYSQMADITKSMLKKSLDALVNIDVELAADILKLDDEVDRLRSEAYDIIKRVIAEKPKQAGFLINLLLVSRHLERLADHTTNIAEEVIYMVEGEIVRHGKLVTGT